MHHALIPSWAAIGANPNTRHFEKILGLALEDWMT
jgi:hypothetical protein